MAPQLVGPLLLRRGAKESRERLAVYEMSAVAQFAARASASVLTGGLCLPASLEACQTYFLKAIQ